MKRTETRYLAKAAGVSLRVEGGGDSGKPPVIVGYAAVFNSLSQELVEGGRSFKETIKPGAFKGALAAMPDMRGCYNHEEVIGRSKSGTLRVSEDDVGLRYEIDVPNTTAGRDLVEKINRGDVDGSSFKFRMQAKGESWRQENGTAIREISQVASLMDVGPVDFPAYLETSGRVAVRRLPPFAARALAGAGQSKRDAGEDQSVTAALAAAAASYKAVITAGRAVIDAGNDQVDLAGVAATFTDAAKAAISASRLAVDAFTAMPADSQADGDEDDAIDSFMGYGNTGYSTSNQAKSVFYADGGDAALAAASYAATCADVTAALLWLAYNYQWGYARSTAPKGEIRAIPPGDAKLIDAWKTGYEARRLDILRAM